MASSHIIRLGKIKGENGVLVALKHNKRTLQNERAAGANINAIKSLLNYSLASDKSPDEIARHAKVQMLMAGIDKPRIDQVRAVEVIFSLPIDRHNQDTRQFFKDCYEWTMATFEGELLSFDVHLDESAPHAHAVILPLIDGKMKGSDMLGGKGNLIRLINKFHADVASRYGLSRSERKSLNNSEKHSIEMLVIARLKNDPAMLSLVWDCFRDAIHNDPIPFAQKLSIELSQARHKTNKSFVDIKRSKGKGSFIP